VSFRHLSYLFSKQNFGIHFTFPGTGTDTYPEAAQREAQTHLSECSKVHFSHPQQPGTGHRGMTTRRAVCPEKKTEKKG